MNWSAKTYQSEFDYVWKHGASLLSQLAPQPGEQIVDLGCGTGQLTAQIADSGADVVGLDSDRAMVTQAQANYPELTFRVADAADFQLGQPVDAVFSNAALHWVLQAEAAADCMVAALKPGGRLVAELGGAGNVQTILSAIEQVSGKQNLNPWYFPALSRYVNLLESAGLVVTFAHLFDRPTPLGADGLAGWLAMFGQRFFSDLSADEWAEMVREIEQVASELYRDGVWVADYKRLRIVAVKP